jgi:hypothetical protein
MKPVLWLCSPFLMLALMTGCDPAPEPEPSPPEPPVPEMPADDPVIQEQASPMQINESVASAQSNLAERLGVELSDVTIIEARQVTWSDGSLGCPEPDMMYTQALVEGYFILLQAHDKRYAYHAGRDGQPFYCPEGRSQPPASGGPTIY